MGGGGNRKLEALARREAGAYARARTHTHMHACSHARAAVRNGCKRRGCGGGSVASLSSVPHPPPLTPCSLFPVVIPISSPHTHTVVRRLSFRRPVSCLHPSLPPCLPSLPYSFPFPSFLLSLSPIVLLPSPPLTVRCLVHHHTRTPHPASEQPPSRMPSLESRSHHRDRRRAWAREGRGRVGGLGARAASAAWAVLVAVVVVPAAGP